MSGAIRRRLRVLLHLLHKKKDRRAAALVKEGEYEKRKQFPSQRIL